MVKPDLGILVVVNLVSLVEQSSSGHVAMVIAFFLP